MEDIKAISQEMYAHLKKNVDDCIDCGECEEKCPYHLPIRQMLKEKHQLLIK